MRIATVGNRINHRNADRGAAARRWVTRTTTRRLLPRVPWLPSLILWCRWWAGGRRRAGRIGSVVTTFGAVERRFAKTGELRREPAAAGAAPLMTLTGARVLAQPPAVVGPGGALLWPYSPQLKRRPAGCDAIWKLPAPERHLAGRTLFAAVDGFSYYHWLTGTLPKLLVGLADAGAAPYDHVLVNARHKGRINFQTESLAWLGVPPGKVVWLERRTHLHCESLTLPPPSSGNEQTEVCAWAVDLVRKAFLPPSLAATTAGELLYVSRVGARRRRLCNDEAAFAGLARLGFERVTLEAMPLAAQIDRFRSARVVVGLHGAGLTNLLFCRPGTQVVEILPAAWPNPCFRNLAATVALGYRTVPARSVGTRRGFAADAEVDIEQLWDAASAAIKIARVYI